VGSTIDGASIVCGAKKKEEIHSKVLCSEGPSKVSHAVTGEKRGFRGGRPL